MALNDRLLIAILALLSSVQVANGQTNPNSTYSDPDEIRIIASQAIKQAALEPFSQAERSKLCKRGRGFIDFACQVDSSGRIEKITGVKLYQAAQYLPPLILEKLKRSVCKNVLFHVPVADKSPQMSRFRKPSVVIPLRAFCK